MRLDRDRLVGGAVLVVAIAIAVLVSSLVSGARERGVDALRQSKLDEVTSAARSFNQRVTASVSNAAGLAAQEFEFTVGSTKDQEFMDNLLSLIPDPRTGFFIVDLEGTVTAGVLLDHGLGIGDRYDRADEAVGTETFAAGRGVILDVREGVTTTSPVSSYLFPVLDRSTGALRGTFVFESEVGPETDFSEEIAQLKADNSARWAFTDGSGTVIAATDRSSIGRSIDNPDLASLAGGVYDIGDEIVVVGEVPVAGWRLLFRQDRDEFVSELAGPLDRAGALVAAVLVLAGGAIGVALTSRLRAARIEQERLRQLTERQEEFISIVSHELRTPVAGVVGFLQTTADHWPQLTDDERRSAVDRAMVNARRLQSLTRDVLEAEQAESGRLRLVTEETDFNETIRAAVDLAGSAMGARRIDVSMPAEPIRFEFDPDRIGQVVTNLLDNADKNSPPGQPVAVKVTRFDGAVEVEVRDHGRGLDPATADHVFEKFTRGRDSSGVDGTGLGLFVCRSIVEAHGGTISAGGGDDGGAVFRFRLPLVKA